MITWNHLVMLTPRPTFPKDGISRIPCAVITSFKVSIAILLFLLAKPGQKMADVNKHVSSIGVLRVLILDYTSVHTSTDLGSYTTP